ncbi:uncharacterized protein HKW66_Vig0064790 [Vigna angularis]|uniref:Uncharacterized protein n=1 Tax=Phaseolus angularis TaxID=3914 RepID=A0A8T0KD85_PHAAN|nr:uncharacterized protein HKW66_Vig0064790 [Vigna angularis]
MFEVVVNLDRDQYLHLKTLRNMGLAKQLRDAKKKARFGEACISGLGEVAAKLARKEIESRLMAEDEGIAILVADTIHVSARVDSGDLKVDSGGFKVADG